MSDLLAARTQMAVSLGFHILFAVAGMTLPLMMTVAEALYLKTGKPHYRDLTKRWSKGTAILFAVGAVSGTVLSFELGLLWPEFMRRAGPTVGLPFGLEGFAFFFEAIFLGLYLYGWDRISPRLHFACGVGITISGLSSAIFVTAVNAWMNDPGAVAGGKLPAFDMWAAFRSDAFPTQATHMALAAYCSVALLAMGIHCGALLQDRKSQFHRAAVRICAGLVIATVPLQLVSGDFSAKYLARHQPLKLAAAEGLFETQARAPLAIFGWPNEEAKHLDWAIEVPGGLSFLATGSFEGEVKGLDSAPPELWPPLAPVHLAFQIMIACGGLMLAHAGLAAWLWRRGALFRHRWFLWASVFASPLGLLAIEAGWVVTEVGRQPWILVGVMRTADAVTPMPGLAAPLLSITTLYLVLGVVVVVMLRRHVLAAGENSQ